VNQNRIPGTQARTIAEGVGKTIKKQFALFRAAGPIAKSSFETLVTLSAFPHDASRRALL
jgi:hypothetical protein